MDIAALIISVIALVTSVIVACVEYYRDFKITTINLEFEFYKEIYMEHLIKKIPRARDVIWIDEGYMVRDTQMLLDELNEVRRDSLYFMYNNKGFYQELKESLQELEDYIVSSEGKVILTNEQGVFFQKIQIGLDKIYRIISDAYNGKYNI